MVSWQDRLLGLGAAGLGVAGYVARGAAGRRTTGFALRRSTVRRDLQLYRPVRFQDEARGVGCCLTGVGGCFRRSIGGGGRRRFLQQGLKRVPERIGQAIRKTRSRAVILTISCLADDSVQRLAHMLRSLLEGVCIQRAREHRREVAARALRGRFWRGLVGRGGPQHVEQLL